MNFKVEYPRVFQANLDETEEKCRKIKIKEKKFFLLLQNYVYQLKYLT